MRFFSALILLSFFLSSCNKSIHISRDQFLKVGQNVPAPDVNNYRSVQERPNQNPEMSVAMAISGGGSRAANFALGIMMELENINLSFKQNALNEIDYFSTVSGGGFAAGAYIAALYEHHYVKPFEEGFRLNNAYEECVKDCLGRSYAKPMLRNYFLNPRLWFSHLDEGDILEREVDNYVLGYKDRKKIQGAKVRSITLGDMFIPKDSINKEVILPLHVANGTNFLNMSIVPFTPKILDNYMISGYSHRVKRYHTKKKMNTYDMPHAVGIKASGSFPVAISTTTLESCYDTKKCFLQITDGGVSDNIGYKTAMELLLSDKEAKQKILFVVDADNTGIANTFTGNQKGSSLFRMVGKLAYSSLDSKQIVLEKELTEICKFKNVTLIYFSFEELIKNNTAETPKSINPTFERERLTQILNNDMQNVSEVDMQILYELTINIATKYSITEAEQKFLSLIGRKIVDMKKDEILQVIK